MNDFAVLEALNLPVRFLPRLTSKESMTRSLLIYQKALREQYGEAIARALSENSPEALIDALLRHAHASRAHSIHIEERPEGVSVYYRIAHVLYEAMMLPTRIAEQLFGTLAKMVQVVAPLDEEVRVRAHHSKTAQGRKTTLHLTPVSKGVHGFTLESLGLHGESLERVHRALSQKSGLVLVCGPMGAGKTTALYTLLDQLQSPSRSLATVEEKIEFAFPRVSQTEVDRSLGLTTAAALRTVLKHDPDVVLVAEINDPQTALVAVQAANRGVLVLAGIETANASSGIEKLLALGVPEALLIGVLRASVGVAVAETLSNPQMRKLSRDEESALAAEADLVRIFAALKEESVISKQSQWKDVEVTVGGEPAGHVGLQEVLVPNETYMTLVEDRIFKSVQGKVKVV